MPCGRADRCDAQLYGDRSERQRRATDHVELLKSVKVMCEYSPNGAEK
jgi:hypothetical protein